jgi:glycosyltransferase involved in cell wall biosynthesis
MHVVIVSDYGHINGGAAKVAIMGVRALAEHGHRVSFVCAVDPIDPVLDHANLRIHHLDLRDVWTERNPLRAARDGIWNAPAGRRLADVLAGFDRRDTIVHLHQWTKAFSPSAIAAAARARLPYVLTLHDYFLFCPNGLYFDHGRRAPCRRQPLSPGCLIAGCDARSRAYKAVRVIRQATSNAALRWARSPLNLIHVSTFARDITRPFLPPDARHFVVHNPSTMPKLAPVPVRANDTFVYVGRFTPEKGSVAFAEVTHAAGVKAAFLGEGPERERIRRANPRAEIQPWASAGAVEAFLGRARALVFPSLWYEASGLVVLEALSKGIPVVCSRTTGAADWIEDGANGFLVELGDAAALGERLARLRADDALAERLGRQAYERYWRDAPTLATYAERMEACYQAIADGQLPT